MLTHSHGVLTGKQRWSLPCLLSGRGCQVGRTGKVRLAAFLQEAKLYLLLQPPWGPGKGQRGWD